MSSAIRSHLFEPAWRGSRRAEYAGKGQLNIVTGRRPLIIGEVLFDQFPDGQRVLGGAPFNVAWNLQGFGLSPLFVSAVGADDEGREIRERMESWGMATDGLQTVAGAPTGSVEVTFSGGQPSYEILDQRAYDFIEAAHVPTAECGLLYTGSLAFRNEPSRSTIERLMSTSGLPRFVDVNIRQPWFDRGWLPILLGGARWAKLNDDELRWITGRDLTGDDELLAAARELLQIHGGQCYWITRGGDGAMAVDSAGRSAFARAPEPDPMVDTVGAGDAFAAATIAGLLQQWPLERSLRAAVGFASRVCGLRGATTRDRSHYTGLDAASEAG